MAAYRVLYWQEFPVQVKAEDERGEINLQLDSRFQELIDAAAMERNLAGTDAYLEAWRWSQPEQRTGDARAVAEAVQRELEASFGFSPRSDRA